MVSNRTYYTVSAVVFTVVAAAHLLRALQGLPVQVGSWAAPVWLSWVAVVFAGALASWGFRLATSGD